MNTRTASHPDRTQDRAHRPHQPLGTADTRPVPTRAPPARRLELSLSQIVGGSLAAATAAALGSRLGVVGTITGAAVASLVASVASAVYTASLEHTQQRFSAALGTVRGGPPRPGSLARRVLVGAAVVFALTAAAVTATELMTGRSLDGDPGGTTVSTTLQRSPEGSAPRQPERAGTPPSPTAASATPSPTSSATPSDGATTDPTGATGATGQPSRAATPGAGPSTDPAPSGTPGATPSAGPTTGGPSGGASSPAAEPSATVSAVLPRNP